MKLKKYVYSDIDVDQDFKKVLQKRLEARYEKKPNIYSKILAWIIWSTIFSCIALASPSIRESIWSFFDSIFSPLYSSSKNILTKDSNFQEQWKFLYIHSWNNEIILVASWDYEKDFLSWKNQIFLTQNTYDKEIFKNKSLEANFSNQLEKIFQKHMQESKLSWFSWTNLFLNMDVQNYKNLINIILTSQFDEWGAHPENQIHSLWFDKNNGQIFDTKNIYTNIEDISKYVYENLSKKFDDIEKDMIDYQWIKPIDENYKTFILSWQDFYVIIPRYQALPWYLWEQKILLPKNLLNPNFQN